MESQQQFAASLSPPRWKNGLQWLKNEYVLVVILCIGLLVRLPYLFGQVLDWDEANVLAISQLPFPELVRFSFIHDIHPFGSFAAVSLWTFLFGSRSDDILHLFGLFWSLLGLVAAYGSIRLLSGRVMSAALCVLLLALAPIDIRYAHFFTAPPMNTALVLCAWACFLRLLQTPLEKSLLKRPAYWGYILTSFYATQLYASGPFFFLFQGVALLMTWKHWPRQAKWTMLGSGILVLLLSVPHLLVLAQPWHLIHDAQMQHLHPQVNFSFFLNTPMNLLFFNFDLRNDGPDLSIMPTFWSTFPLLLAVYATLITGGILLFRQNRQRFWLTLLMGPIPLVVAFLLSRAGFGLFNYRSMLYTIVPLAYLITTVFTHLYEIPGKRLWASLGLMLLLTLQCTLHKPLSVFGMPDYRILGEHLRQLAKPDDGIVAYPGLSSLPILRYYRPQDFGYSKTVINWTPKQGESAFNQIDRNDAQYFMVTGEDMISRPAVQQAFVDFQKKHRRIIFIFRQVPKPLMPFIDCSKELWSVDIPGSSRISCKYP